MRRTAITVRGLLQAATFLTVLFSWATLFGAAHRYLELFSHFRLQYLLASVVLLLAFLFMRRRIEIIALVATAVLNASLVVPWYGVPGTQAAAIGPTLTLLLANVHAGNDRYEELLTLIDESQPDVVVLQEMTPVWLANVAPALGEYSHQLTIPRNDPFGIGIFSRRPLLSTSVIDSPPLGFPTLVAALELAGRPLTLITTHPMPPIGRFGHEARNEQLRSVGTLVIDRRTDVLIGDLNTTMWGPNYISLEDRTGLHNSRRGFGVLPSWPTFLPLELIPLDHCLVSDRIDVLETKLGRDIGSDHRPLLVRLAWRSGNDG
jgi:endonuclease/exonuclease/phosphatase (EEP) superfamily protein YafD